MIDSIKITVESKDLEAGKAKMLVDLIKDHKQLKFYQEVDCNKNSKDSDLNEFNKRINRLNVINNGTNTRKL